MTLARRHVSAIGGALAGATLSLALAQTPAFRVETRLIEVPVVVRDGRTGEAVGGLTAADFVLLEDGKPQRIEYFSSYEAPVRAGRERVRAGGEAATSGVFRNRRGSEGGEAPVVAVLIDGFNARYEDQYYAAMAAVDVIERGEDRAQWGVYFLGRFGVRVLHDYSTNTESVVSRLRALRAAGNSVEGLGAGAEFGIGSSQTLLERRASELVIRYEEERRLRTTLSAIRDIGRHLSALPGRKSLIWLTAGASLVKVVRNMPELWHSTLETLNDASVAVYTVDSQGVRTSRGFLAEGASGPLNLRPRLGSPMEETQLMGALAAATGGLSFINSNNLAKGVQAALADSRAFYRLGYRPAHASWNGRQVALRVRVPGRKNLELRYRQSYRARPLETLSQPAREALLASAIVSPLEAVEVGITARLARQAGSEETLLQLTLDPGSVTLEESGGRYRGRFDVRLVQSSAEAKVLDDITDEVNLDLKLAEAERAYADGFHYQRKVSIGPEARTLKIAFCDHFTGRLGTLRVEVGP